MLAHMKMIDFGETVDRFGDAIELFLRNSHRRQRTGADALGCEDRADAGDLSLAPQLFEQAQNGPLGDAEARGELGERRRTERKIALKIVEQVNIERMIRSVFKHRHRPPEGRQSKSTDE
jgi:hypothetical protein